MTSQPMRTRIKICGMTDPNLVHDAVEMGVDAIGMILHADSPRKVSVDLAKKIRREVPAFVSLVGVFVNCDLSRINDVSRAVGLDLVQLHGGEDNDFGTQLTLPFIKAIRARSFDQVAKELTAYPSSRALLLDTYVKGQHGGTGQQIDVSVWPRDSDKKLILAGGLSANNVADLINQVRPYAVDFNSGLEDSPGEKNPELMARAVAAVNNC